MRSRPALLVLAVAAASAAGCGGSHAAATSTGGSTTRATATSQRNDAARPLPIRRLVPVDAGTLDQPVQDAAAAAFGGGAVLLGGLTAADTSRDDIVTVSRSGSRRAGHLPGVVLRLISAWIKSGRKGRL